VVAVDLRGSRGFGYCLGLNAGSRRDQQDRGRDRPRKCYRGAHNQRVVESVDVSLRVPAEGRAWRHQRSQRRDSNCHTGRKIDALIDIRLRPGSDDGAFERLKEDLAIETNTRVVTRALRAG
jgi:hypothetical protein